MSWPKASELAEPIVESPNEADAAVMVVSFARMGLLAMSVATFRTAGVPVLVFKFDLVKAYKKTGQQRATLWRRAAGVARGGVRLGCK